MHASPRSGHGRTLPFFPSNIFIESFQMRILKKRSPSLAATSLRVLAENPVASAIAAPVALMATAAVVNRKLADKAQRENPPQGRLIDIDEQSGRLHEEIRHSKMRRVARAGHMIQQSDTADLMAAIDEAAAETLH